MKGHWMDPALLRPTQVTVGLVESAKKRERLRLMHAKERQDWLAEHPVPAVLGPKGRAFIIDHHHLARALCDGALGEAWVQTTEDLSHLEKEAFWVAMSERAWAHPFDENGLALPHSCIPKHVGELRDDPYRSLAGLAREAGAFQKTPTPFAEFAWADFFRRELPGVTSCKRFEGFLAEAVLLARCERAGHLPGFILKQTLTGT
jgi:hypothetical protein